MSFLENSFFKQFTAGITIGRCDFWSINSSVIDYRNSGDNPPVTWNHSVTIIREMGLSVLMAKDGSKMSEIFVDEQVSAGGICGGLLEI